MNEAYLIDTHVLLWYIKGEKRLSQPTKELIDSIDNTIYISKASLWEMAIKSSLGKLTIGISLDKLASYLEEEGFVVLDFDFSDLLQLHQLPFHHGDPFDRLIIAQALVHQLTIISDDRNFGHYTANLLSA
ncbi:type II toxin-antitoxin system VapC family toxin [Spirosoma sp. KCTC 42546]|uniref:type II toxin-antitoxin system VapC family toxin n=1 Tax=Spirosoma sp. KCTC 42546 TaxID=2520506 RepID=UPI00115950B1|nr:type II toxin-antitoxin system VapC family toxin [Spirosoma sp. KCTC 42546]QDK82271.1 type II toxin-antitoxin system VapC family toxin [Spirosoma sp. KCTC 42546]